MISDHIRRHPITAYTLIAYLIPWIGSLILVGPKFLHGETISIADLMNMGLMMFAGPSFAGVTLTYFIDGRSGVGNLFSRMKRWRSGITWYSIALFLPPILILLVLLSMSILVSPDFTPGLFPFGLVLGLTTGFFEEIGWTGFLYPKLRATNTSFNAAIGVGLIHGVWHFMATYLGAAQFIGIYFIPYFVGMWIIGMTAMRILQVWVYNHTDESILMIQLMHGSSTGCLLALSPVIEIPANETLWFFIYAVVLWIVVAGVIKRYGTKLKKSVEYNPYSIRNRECDDEQFRLQKVI